MLSSCKIWMIFLLLCSQYPTAFGQTSMKPAADSPPAAGSAPAENSVATNKITPDNKENSGSPSVIFLPSFGPQNAEESAPSVSSGPGIGSLPPETPAVSRILGAAQECGCVTQLVLDIMTEHSWSSIVILLSDGGKLLTESCLRGVGQKSGAGLLQQLWGRELQVTIERASEARQLLRPPSEARHQYFLVEDNSITRQLLAEASERELLSYTTWALLTDALQLPSFAALTSTLEAFIVSDILLLEYNQCSAQISSMYRVGPRVTEVQHEKGGLWTATQRFQGDPLSNNKLDRRSDFKGYPMKGIGVSVFDFFTTYLPDGGVSGFVGDLVTTLKKTHNFTLTYRVLEGYGYGKLINNNKENRWNGMVGELQNKRVDLTVSELSITQQRSEVVTYTQPIRVISRKLFVSLVEDTRKKILIYFSPMAPTIYLCVFVTMLGMIVILVTMDRAVFKYVPGKYSGQPTSISTSTWYIISALMQQGCVSYPSGHSPRVVFWFVFIFALLIYTAYSATLVSLLAVRIPAALPFTNLFELAKLTSWSAGCNVDDLFQVTASQTCSVEPRSAECQTLFDVWNNNVMKSEDNLMPNYIAGLKRALEGEYVFIGVGVTTRYYIRQLPIQEACKIRELPGMYIQGGIGIGLQYHSPFQPSFDKSIQKIREMGEMEKLVTTWLDREDICDNSNNISAADMIDVSSLFVLLLFGTGLSILIFAGERLIKICGKETGPQSEGGSPAEQFQYQGNGAR